MKTEKGRKELLQKKRIRPQHPSSRVVIKKGSGGGKIERGGRRKKTLGKKEMFRTTKKAAQRGNDAASGRLVLHFCGGAAGREKTVGEETEIVEGKRNKQRKGQAHLTITCGSSREDRTLRCLCKKKSRNKEKAR